MPLNCNCFKRPDSPDEAPIKLEDTSLQGRRFTLSSDLTHDPSFSSELTPPYLHDVFDSNRTSIDPITPHSAQFMIRRRESLQAIHHAARKLKDKLSRESAATDGVSPKTSRRDVRTDITDSISLVQDNDAVLIKTPGSSLPRSDHHNHGGSIRLSPQQLRQILGRSRTPSPQPSSRPQVAVQSLQDMQPITGLSQGGQTRVLSKMLTDRASRDVSQETRAEAPSTPSEIKARLRKYTFPDTPNRLDQTTPARTSFSDQAADLMPRQASGISVPAPTTDLSLADAVIEPEASTDKDARLVGGQDITVIDDTSRPTSPSHIGNRPSWTRGASGAFRESHKCIDTSNKPATDAGEDIGGVDGSSASRSRSQSDGSNAKSIHLYNMRISQRLASSNANLLSSASSPNLRAVSSSSLSWKTGAELLPFPPQRRPSSSEFSALSGHIAFHAPRQRDGSSQYSLRSACTNLFSPDQLTSQPLSLAESRNPLGFRKSATSSRQNSGRQSSEALDMGYSHTKQGQHLRRALNVAKTRNESVYSLGSDDKNARRLLRSQSLIGSHSDTNSNVLQRANSASSTRHFSQADIDDLYHEISKRSTPSSRVVSRFDGQNEGPSLRPSLLNPDQTARVSSAGLSRPSTHSRRTPSVNMSPRRKPSSSLGLDPLGSSVWDKALREHAKEDAKIMLRNPGSFSAEIERRRSTRLRLTSDSLQPFSSLDYSEDSELVPGPIYRSPLRPIPASNRPASSGSDTSSWSRYPSHTRKDRIDSPATEADDVRSRDFAPVTPTKKRVSVSRSLPTITFESPVKEKITPTKRFQRKVKKAHSARLIQIKSSWKDLKRTKLLEISGKLAIDDARGHRSSISDGTAGAGTKMPELEMLSPLPMSPLHESFEGGYFPSLEDLSKPIMPITQNVSTVIRNLEDDKELDAKKGRKGKKSKKSKVKDRIKVFESRAKHASPIKTDETTTSPTNEIPMIPWNQMYDSCVKLPFSPSLSTIASPASTTTLAIDRWNWNNARASPGTRPLFSPPAKGRASLGGVSAVNVFASGAGATAEPVKFNLDAMITPSRLEAEERQGFGGMKTPPSMFRKKMSGDVQVSPGGMGGMGMLSPNLLGQGQGQGFHLQGPSPPVMKDSKLQAPPMGKKEFKLGAVPLERRKKVDADTHLVIEAVAATYAAASNAEVTPSFSTTPVLKSGFSLGLGAPGESGGGLLERRKGRAKAAQEAENGKGQGVALYSGESAAGGLSLAVQGVNERRISEVDPLDGRESRLGEGPSEGRSEDGTEGFSWIKQGPLDVGGNEGKERRDTVEVDPMDILGRGSIATRAKERGMSTSEHMQMLGS